MNYPAALVLSGICWSGVLWRLAPMASFPSSIMIGIITALVTGYTLRGLIQRVWGWRWIALPLLNIAIGSVTFGTLLPVALSVMDRHQMDREAFLNFPVIFGFYSLTLFIWITYPASLLTHYLLRRIALPKVSDQKPRRTRRR